MTPAQAPRRNTSRLWEEAGMLLVLIVLFAGCSLFVPNFANARNMAGLGLAVSMTGMVACTMLFCLASGHFDLSVGSVVACAGVLTAVTLNRTGSIAAGLAAGLAVGALVGLINGVVIAKLKINALITTLAMMQIVRGLAFIFAPGGVSVSVLDERFFVLGNTSFLSIPTPVWITMLCFAAYGLLLQYTIFGRNTLAIGGNEEAARLAGVAVDRIKITIFVLQGAMAAFAGIVMASRMTSGQPNVGQGLELAVISACVLGGVSLTGGVGNMLFVISGVLIMGIVQNAMNLMNVPTFYQYVVSGAILLAAVILDRLRSCRKESWMSKRSASRSLAAGLALVLGTAAVSHAQAPLVPEAVRAEPDGTALAGGRQPDAAGRTRPAEMDPRLVALAATNGHLAADALARCRRYVEGWLAHADPATGLIPQNLWGTDLQKPNKQLRVSNGIWIACDSAADNYAFMVLTCALTDRGLLEGRMLDILETETRLTSRIGNLPDVWSFEKNNFRHDQPNIERMVNYSVEYPKDGLLPLMEWLGRSPWSERAIGIVEDVWKHASVETPFGKLPTASMETHGELMQCCARFYWFTGDRRFLEWAVRLADYYLLGDRHPTQHKTGADVDQKAYYGRDNSKVFQVMLQDHGSEAIGGLSEVYAAVAAAMPEKREAYRKPLHDLLDNILQYGRDANGMLYHSYDPFTGEFNDRVNDGWGYVFNAFYTVWMVDGTEAYRDAVVNVLSHLNTHYHPSRYAWGTMDFLADSAEGAINLVNREPNPAVDAWIDEMMRRLLALQKPDGTIEGWHGDGNYARTALMYALWKSQGCRIEPWRADVKLGAAREGERLVLSLSAEQPWSGKIIFDRPRHRLDMHLPLDYPRINQFPEWFVVAPDDTVVVQGAAGAPAEVMRGDALLSGVAVNLAAGEQRIIVAHKRSP